MRDVTGELTTLVREISGREGPIHPDTRLIDDLAFNSIDFIEVAAWISQRCGKEVDTIRIQTCKTLGELILQVEI